MSFKSLKSARVLTRHIGSAAFAAAICVAAVSAWAAGPLNSIDDVRVAPLLTTHWAQGDVGGANCYNYYTPLNRVCGCTATALGQIMYYHRYPTTRILPGETLYDTIDDYGTYSVGTDGNGGMTNTTTGVYTAFDPPYGGPYDWDLMVASPTSATPENSRKAIGRLTRDAGFAVFSHYFSNGSTSGYTAAVASSIILNLHYADAVRTTGFNANKLIANLEAGLPVEVGLTDHAVVADGYGYHDDKLYIHINYGYGGSSDGWYDTTTDINGKSIGDMVANIFPPTLGARHSSVISGRVLDTSGNPVANATVTATGATNVTTTSSANGSYAFILPAGNYTFAASKSGAAGSSAYTVAASEQKTRAEGDGWGSGVNNSASGVDVTVYTESDFAKSWSNNANDGRFDNPQNWTGGTLPASGDDVAVFVSDDTVISSETAMTVGKVSVPSGTVRFSGSGAVITLGGLNLLSAGSTVEITGREGLANGSIKGVGTLVVNPGAGNTYTMPKDNGNNAVPFDAAYFWGETVIKSGTVKFGNIWSFGSRRDNDDNRQIPTVRVKGGATLDENGLSTGDYSGETLRVILEEGATLKSTGNSSSGLTSILLEGNATVDTSSGKVVACYGYDSYASSPVWVSLGTNTLTKVGSGQFYLSGCYCIGTGTFDVQEGEVRVRVDSWNYFPTSTLADGTLRIRSGATFTLEARGANPTHFTVKDLVLDGILARTTADCVFTATGTVTGSGTAAALTLAQGAVFKPSGAGYLTITDSLSGVFELDMSGVDLSGAQDIPLVSVPSALADSVRFAPATIPEGWSVLRDPENGNVRYLLIEGEAVEMPTSPTPTAFSVGQQTAVTLTCATEGATIYYTTDGSDPTTSSTAYSAPFTVTDGTTVKARAYKTGLRDSLIYIATFTYVPPATLTHRWSFNGSSDSECLADSVGGVNAMKGVSGTVTWDNGTAIVASDGSGNDKGHLEISGGVLGSGDATLEIWYEKLENPGAWSSAFAYGRDGDNRFQINTAYGYNQEYGGNTGSSRSPVTAKIGGTDRISGGDWNKGCLASLVPNLPQHISITFKRNGDGSTTVRWMSRDCVTGFLMKECSGTIPSWTLADAPDYILTLGRDIGSLYDLKAKFHEVRTWNGVLSDEQLSANAFAGPDAPIGGRESAFSTGFDIAAGSTFTIGKEGMFRTDGSVGVGTGASIVFDTANYNGTEMKFVTGGFSLPAGASSVLDFVTLTDSDNYVARVDGGTITVASAQPAYAKWTGASVPTSAADLANAANWTCYGQDGTTVMSGAMPGSLTTLLIEGTTSFTLPAGVTPTCGSVLIGGHAAPHYGRIASTGGDNNWITFRERPLTDYTPCGEKAVSYLDRTSGNSPSDLGGSQLRFDGWIYVSAELAGRWDIRTKMDDMITFAIDGEWQFFLNTYQYAITAGSYVSEGWHRFTLIVRDTGGGYGANMTLNGKNYPFVVSINGGAELGFSQLTFGTGPSTVTLADDCDWSALGEVNLANGVIIDLNGHNLTLNDFTTDSFGSMVTNTTDTMSTMIFNKDPFTSNANAQGLLHGVGENITLVQDGAKSATWTGGGNDGNPANAANWEVKLGTLVIANAVPDSNTSVLMQGQNINMQLSDDTTLRCASFQIGNCTFTADCDWSTLPVTPSISGTANLNGHVLTLNHLVAVAGSSFSNSSQTDGEVRFYADGGTVTATETTFIDNIANLTTAANAKIVIIRSEGDASGTLNVGAVNNHTMFRAESGTISMTANGQVGMVNGGVGYLDISGGTVNFCTANNRGLQLGTANARSYVTISDGKLLANWIDAGHDDVAECTIVQTGGEVETGVNNNGNLWLGRNARGRATYTLSGGSIYLRRGTLDVGNYGAGVFVQNGGSVTLGDGDCRIGEYGGANGTYTLNDGAITGKYWMRVGDQNKAIGAFTQNGGTVTFKVGANNDGNWVDIAEKTGGNGVYTINGGTLEVGTSNNGGGIYLGWNGGAGRFVMNGGTVTTPTITSGNGGSMVVLNGGTIKVAKNGGVNSSKHASDIGIFKNISNLVFGQTPTTVDTDGHNTKIVGCDYSTVNGGALTKAGAGTLTLDALPPVDLLTVSNGVLALAASSASIDNTEHVPLRHRWSFNGSTEEDCLKDSITSRSATKIGSALAFADGEVTMSGDGNSTGSLNLGKGLMPSGDATIEIWATRTGVKTWARVLDIGSTTDDYFTMTWVNSGNGSQDQVILRKKAVDNTSNNTMVYTDNVKYHISVTFKANSDGSTTVSWARRNVETGAVEKSSSKTYSAWTLTDLLAGNFYLGHSQWSGDRDANAKYDEVRIWNGVLTADALTLSAQKGPDATAADIADIVAANAVSEAPLRVIDIASGGTLDLGGNTLVQPVVSGGGTVQNGTLTATKELRAKPGDCLTIGSGATFNIDGTKVTFRAEDLARAKPTTYTLVKAANGGTITGTLLQPDTDAALPKGWHVTQTPGFVKLHKNGVAIFFR